MSNPYLKFVGWYTSGISGGLFHLSDEYRAFLRAGYLCQACGETLMSAWGVSTIKPFNMDGTPANILTSTFNAAYFACPKCGHTWWVHDDPTRIAKFGETK